MLVDTSAAHRAATVPSCLDPDVADVMRASDVFVLPTISDSQPTVIMEAMASRLPVVSTTQGGIPDMVEHGVDGTLVEPDNVPQLALALADMMGLAGAEKRSAFYGRESRPHFSCHRFSLPRSASRCVVPAMAALP